MTLTEVYQLMLQEESDLASMSYYDHIEVDEGRKCFRPSLYLRKLVEDRSTLMIRFTT